MVRWGTRHFGTRATRQKNPTITSRSTSGGQLSTPLCADMIARAANWYATRSGRVVGPDGRKRSSDWCPAERGVARAARSTLRSAGHRATALSMGMTQDYEIAVKEGATMVRLGTTLFGTRAT